MTMQIATAIRELCGVSEEVSYGVYPGSRRALVRELSSKGFKDQQAIDQTLSILANVKALKLHASYFKWHEPN